MSNATPERASVARRAERPAAGLLLGTGATQSVAQSPPQAVAERGPESAALVHDESGLRVTAYRQPLLTRDTPFQQLAQCRGA